MVILRPHHGICIQNFRGKGYSPEFVERMSVVIEELERHPQQKVKLKIAPDILCEKCPNQKGKGCASDPKPVEYDQRCLSVCSLRDGQEISWNEFREKVKKEILSAGKLGRVCDQCQWLSICR